MNSITQQIRIKARRWDFAVSLFYAAIVAAGFGLAAELSEIKPVMRINAETGECVEVKHPIFTCYFHPLNIPREQVYGHKTMAFVDEGKRIDRW